LQILNKKIGKMSLNSKKIRSRIEDPVIIYYELKYFAKNYYSGDFNLNAENTV